MADSPTPTASCTRLAAQDRHAPKEAVPPALSTFGSRRGGWVRSAVRAHLKVAAEESTI